MTPFQVTYIDSCASTNDEAKKRSPYCVIYAGRQTKGRGRMGRTWFDGAGNLMMSIVLPKPEQAHLYSFMASLAVAQSIAFLSPRIKWPNDVLVDGAKICGILLETTADKLIIGIGVNIESYPESGLLYKATSLKEQGRATETKKLLEDILQNLSFVIHCFERKGFTPIRRDWLEFATGIGKPITVKLPTSELAGIFDSIDETGALILISSDTKKHVVTAGDVFIID